MTITVARPQPSLSRWLPKMLGRALDALGVVAGQISVAIVDDAAMTGLHRQYLGVDSMTDVLSFDLRDDTHADTTAPQPSSASDGPEQRDAIIEGEIVINLDEAARQAARRDHDARLEVVLYAVHGLLHLLGYDDHDPQQAAAMHQREDEILTRIGLGAVYHRDDRGCCPPEIQA